MAKDINEFIAKLPLAQRKKIEARAADLIVEELTLNNLQELTSRIAKLTPEKLAIVGKIVERLESSAPNSSMTLDQLIDEFEREHPELLHLLAQ